MWTLESKVALPLWLPDPGTAGCRMGFSTRRGGISEPPYDTLNLGLSTADRPDAVEENRRRLLSALGLEPGRVATAGQVHGATVTLVTSAGLHRQCDALVTREPALALAVTGADCLPLLYSAPGAVAVAHAGWRGAVAGVAEAALAALCQTAGVRPDQVRVHFGPCIRDCCYVVGPEVAHQFPPSAIRRAGDELYLSVPDAVRTRLLAAGLPATSLEDTGACTACEPAWYFSHRRDRGLTGRQWGVIAVLDSTG